MSPYRHYRAPRGEGEVLCDPAWGELAEVWRRNREEAVCAGSKLTVDRWLARPDLLDQARAYSRTYRGDLPAVPTISVLDPPPIVMAGHQPQMFHPGVWFKNFALDALAKQTGAIAVNLIIDNDAFRRVSLRVPGGTADNPHIESISFDRPGVELPLEERTILDRPLAASFAERVQETIRPLVPDPLIGEYWKLVMEASQSNDRWGVCLAQARHRLEESLGLSTLEVPLSQLCDEAPFHWFASDLLVRLPEFIRCYNESLADYRAAHRLRSKAHPVPDLEVDGEWMEAPFWIWTRESPRRRRLWVRRVGSGLELGDRGGLSAPFHAFVDLQVSGWKIRPRALTTTLYARLFLCDLFLHGIGGGKYDQVTERIAKSFYGVELPACAVISGTWRLPIKRSEFRPEELPRVEESLRRLQFDPGYFLAQRVGDEPSIELAGLLAERAKWIGADLAPKDRRERHLALARIRESLANFAAPLREELLARLSELQRQARIESLLGSREFSFVLFSRQFFHNHLLAFFGEKP